MKKIREVREALPTRTRKSLALLAATSAALAATISIGAVASAAGPNGQQRRPVNLSALARKPVASQIAPTAPANPTATTQPVSPGKTPPAVSPPTTTTTPTTSTPAAPVAPTPTPSGLLHGVYVGAADPSGVASFAAATKTSVSIASEYLPSSSGWAGMDGANGGLDWMFAGGWTGSGYTLSLGVPMIPTTSSGAPVGSLATGASGAYNGYFVSLAQALVAAGESSAYLRLGWEFDGGWYAWSATTPAAEASYAAYFAQIVTAMRAVPGANFSFVWNPDVAAFNDAPYNVALAYPGNAYVNVIGLDTYDQSWASPQTPANAWNQTTLPTLNLAHGFATGKGEPLAFPEWGLAIRGDGHGLGDDPSYVANMLAFMHTPANDVTYESYFNFDVPGQVDAITDGNFPNSLAAFSGDLG